MGSGTVLSASCDCHPPQLNNMSRWSLLRAMWGAPCLSRLCACRGLCGMPYVWPCTVLMFVVVVVLTESYMESHQSDQWNMPLVCGWTCVHWELCAVWSVEIVHMPLACGWTCAHWELCGVLAVWAEKWSRSFVSWLNLCTLKGVLLVRAGGCACASSLWLN